MVIEPILYRIDILEELGEGNFTGVLDALVWSKRDQLLMALVTLDGGLKVRVLAFQRHSRKDANGKPLPEYLGFRDLEPGKKVEILVDRGLRGGLRPFVKAA